MARSHLTLAALATSAVEGLDLTTTEHFGAHGGGDYESALLTARDGRRLVIRVPRSAVAESRQSADLVALRALSAGVRTRLPFGVAEYAGQVPTGDTRAVVYDYLPGSHWKLSSYGTGFAEMVAKAIAAIHTLPTSFVADAGLPVLTAGDATRSASTVIERAQATGLVPLSLLNRWRAAIEDSKLWQFQPTVIHGDLSAASILSDGNKITGVLGWHEIKVGDPARDLAWLIGSRDPDVVERAFHTYGSTRGVNDRQLRQRATLYSELEVAKWLLHGTETRSTATVDDAVEMLTALADDVKGDLENAVSSQTMPTMAVDELEAYLDRERRASSAS